MRSTLLFVLGGFAAFSHTPLAVAQKAAPVAKAPQTPLSGAFSYLDDEAEAGGFDVSASIGKFPVEWSLAEQENGDGYRLRVSASSIELVLHRKSGDAVLASAKTALSGGSFTAQRRGAHWRFLNGNRVVLEAEDNRWQEGKIGFRGAVKNARVQPVEEIFFDDDFMRVKEDAALASARNDPHNGIKISDVKQDDTLWRAVAGKWSTTGLSENPEAQVAQSVNAFAFKTGEAGPSLALAGRPFWSDYGYEASVRPEGSKAIGLAIYAQDAKNYLMMHWSEGEGGQAQLRAVVNGKVRVLDSSPGGFEPKQWYRLKMTVEGGVLRAFVDDGEVLRARSGLFGRGQVGVFADNPSGGEFALFDDVRVRSRRDFHDDFERIVPGRWQTLAGAWQWNGGAAPTNTTPATAVAGDDTWKDYVVGAQISLPAEGSAGLLLHQTAGKGAYLLRVAGSKSKQPFAGRVQILKMAGDKTTVLSESKIGSRFDNGQAMWNFSGERGYLRATVDGRRIVDAFDETLKSGRAGMWAARGGSGVPSVRAFSVEFPEVRPTWAKVPELYELEQQAVTMGGWSTPEGFWSSTVPIAGANAKPAAPETVPTGLLPTGAVDTAVEGAAPSGKTLYHKGAFWGDGRFAFKMPALATGKSFTIALDQAPSGNKENGLSLNFALDKSTLTTKLTRTTNGKARQIAAKPFKLNGAPTDYTVEVMQRGSYLITRLKKTGAETATTLFAARVRA